MSVSGSGARRFKSSHPDHYLQSLTAYPEPFCWSKPSGNANPHLRYSRKHPSLSLPEPAYTFFVKGGSPLNESVEIGREACEMKSTFSQRTSAK